MQYHQTIELKDGSLCTLRSLTERDAQEALALLIQTSGETDFLSRYADEIKITMQEERDYINRKDADPRALEIGAFCDGKMVALAGFRAVDDNDRNRHRADLGLSILRDYWGLGIGSAVMATLIEAARKVCYSQMELLVAADNARAIALYKKFGFEVFGRLENANRHRDGRFTAELSMVLTL